MKIDHEKFISLYKSQYGDLDSSQASGLGTLLGFLEEDREVGDLRGARLHASHGQARMS